MHVPGLPLHNGWLKKKKRVILKKIRLVFKDDPLLGDEHVEESFTVGGHADYAAL